jgi:hypothetical protein
MWGAMQTLQERRMLYQNMRRMASTGCPDLAAYRLPTQLIDKAPRAGAHWTEDWVGPTAYMDIAENSNSCDYRELNPIFPQLSGIQPVVILTRPSSSIIKHLN